MQGAEAGIEAFNSGSNTGESNTGKKTTAGSQVEDEWTRRHAKGGIEVDRADSQKS